jgi:glutaredoxin
MNRIKIYTNEACPYCKSIKEELEKKDIKFINMDTTEHKVTWEDITNLTGVPSVPTVECGDEFLVPGRDFSNPAHLINIIENYREYNYDYTRRTLEKVKTLNYNIGQAFQNLDKVLKQIENKIK